MSELIEAIGFSHGRRSSIICDPETWGRLVDQAKKMRVLSGEVKADNQDLYSPCGCGSGKKFKFCCKNL